MNLQRYMSDAIRRIMAKAYRNVLSNPREAKVEDMIFPIFTNGTLIGPSYITFLKEHLNLIPVISIEGAEHGTDTRRGKGIYKRAMLSVEELHKEDLFFGVSITVTTENFATSQSRF